jgi:hypothetical protein
MKNQLPILKNADLQARFEHDGFVKVSLLDSEKADSLYQYFMDQQDEHDVIKSRFHSTTHTNNPDLIRKIDTQLKEIILPELNKVFQNYEPMMSTYIAKQPGPGSETGLHQDPTFVDEQHFVSANVWIALHDIDHENGNLFFVPGTHRLINSLRVTPTCPTAYDEVKDLLPKNLLEIPVKKGEAVLINHALLHGSTTNLSGAPRIAAVMAIRTAGSDWIYHYLERGESPDKIEKYEVDLETFINLARDTRPTHARFIGNISWDFRQISREDFNAGMKEYSGKNAFNFLLKKLSKANEIFFS